MSQRHSAEVLAAIDERAAAGLQVDRRHTHGLVKGELCVGVEWTQSCSGCFEGGEYMGLAHNYGYDDKAKCYVGYGCDECGHTGKRRVRMWQPADIFYGAAAAWEAA